ncbi:hybrid sensor histidine kinase/response regulator [Pacificimonas flava]|uniref:histidine kinase n=1 Tax=Pacificimonas flava TaxID=1234595 RepID=M2U4F5_9SPHN|nr:hybrid sensor histidine kinase/response regulator [Pacificimonas flava]EMD82902.1 sensory box histidine kinase/response regulator [Pacificimonas flava]MBB5280065.1 two-component system NtrC family sensor kinase [Pacificimonas flava]
MLKSLKRILTAKNINLNYAAALLVIALLLVLTAITAFLNYRETLGNTRQELGSLSRLLDEQTSNFFGSVDLVLDSLAEAQPQALPRYDPDFSATLRTRANGIPYVRALFMIDARGELVQDSDPHASVPVDLSDRSYFRAFLDDPDLTFLIGEPIVSRTQKVRSIPVLRKLTAADGAFAGLIGASVEPRYLNAFYNELELDDAAAVALFSTDGMVLASRAPGDDRIVYSPRRFSIPEHLPEAGMVHSDALDGRDRIISYHLLPELGLGVAVGDGMDSVRRQWWQATWPMLLAVGALVILIAWLTYVLDRRQKERVQQVQRAITTQKLEALGQMTGGIAHDFNNVLAAAAASLRLIQSRGPTPEIMTATEQALARGENLVRQLMSFARRRDLAVARHDANALIANLDQVLKHAAGPDVRLKIELAERLPLCWTDQTQFDAALVNLVVNARHAMPDGGTIRITTALAQRTTDAGELPPGAYVAVIVTDTGVGMTPATLEKIFEPFFTTKGETGTGLGLAQIYGFMRQVGGAVLVESAPGQGSTFRLLFRSDA